MHGCGETGHFIRDCPNIEEAVEEEKKKEERRKKKARLPRTK